MITCNATAQVRRFRCLTARLNDRLIGYLIDHTAVRYANPPTSSSMWLRREGIHAQITCNATGEVRQLRCLSDGSWDGTGKFNCSATTGTAAASGDTHWSFSLLFSNEAFPY